MKTASAPSDRTWMFGLLARLVVGGLFVYMGLSKALDPVDFLKLVRQYDMVQNPFLLNFIAATLPWFEVLCGLLLLAGVGLGGTSLLSLLMLIPFTAIVWQRALAIHAAVGGPFCDIRFDCGCGAGEVAICSKLVENCSMIFLLFWLLLRPSPKFCLRPRLFPSAGPIRPALETAERLS